MTLNTSSNERSNQQSNSPAYFKHYTGFAIAFGFILFVSNIAALKIVDIHGFTFTGAFFIFPFSYIINCVIVEIYGYKNARSAIWYGFFASILASALLYIVACLPPSPHWHLNDAFNQILVPEVRITLASLFSFVIADFINSYLLAKSKTHGVGLFRRIITAAFFSVFIGVITFIGLAYYNTIPNMVLLELMRNAFIKKMLFQIVFFPVTYYLIALMKKVENIDLYDNQTNFNPFSLDNVYSLESYKILKQQNQC